MKQYRTVNLFILGLLLLFSSTTIVAQNTVGTVSNNANASYNGYTLFTNHTTTYLINNCGEVINQWNSTYIDGKSVYLLEDGSILRAGVIVNGDVPIPGIGGIIQKIDWDGNITWEYTYSSSTFTHHHDMFPLPNGNVLILAATKKTLAEAEQAGRDPDLLNEDVLYNEQIIEVQQTGLNTGDIVWEWNIWDHLVQEYDAGEDNFGVIADNPQLLDINYIGVSTKAKNWLHANSIQYNSDLDQIIISARQLNEIYIIDHSTTTSEAASHTGGNSGKGGDILYRWGNPIAYKQGTELDQKLFGQHTPHWIPDSYIDGGKILIFNNGNGRTSDFSTLDIIDPEVDINNNYVYIPNMAYGPVSPDWTYSNPVPTDFFSRIMSSAQRLPNGNTLVCDADSGYFFEIDNTETIVWEYINPQKTNGDIMTQGDVPESNLAFRAFKYDPSYAAFTDRDLTPGNEIEIYMSPSTNNCSLLNNEKFELTDIKIFPNPTSNILNIKTIYNIDSIEVYSILGKLVAENTASNNIRLSHLSKGLYILKIRSRGSIISKKIIKE